MRTKGLGGTWKAILSDGSTNASARISVVAPIYNLRPDSASGPQLVANDSATLWSGTLSSSVGYNEIGAAAAANVWSGSNTDGTSSTNHCSAWTSTSGGGQYGVSNTSTSAWIDSSSGACSASLRLYCVSQ